MCYPMKVQKYLWGLGTKNKPVYVGVHVRRTDYIGLVENVYKENNHCSQKKRKSF